MNNMLTIRDFAAADYSAVCQVWDETGMGGAVRGDDLQSINNTLNAGGRLLVMLHNNEIVGTSWMTSDGRRIYLHHFGILPAFQGRGWSKPLLAASLDWVKETGMQVKLEVHRENSIARELYLNAGFKPLGDYEVLIVRKPDSL
jgi:ribosomal protein S18 acetylase RimI-like enzyme